jgi:hypothetical protein
MVSVGAFVMDSRAVHGVAQRTELGLGPRHRVGHPSGVGNIGRQGKGPTAELLDSRDGRLEPVRGHVDAADVRAELGQTDGHPGADPARGSGDEGSGSVEPKGGGGHGALPRS